MAHAQESSGQVVHGTIPQLIHAADGAPDAKVEAAGHDTPLWRCESAPDRMAFAGEASGVWLSVVVWPAAAELVLLEHLELHDLRHSAHDGLDLPVGAPTARFAAH